MIFTNYKKMYFFLTKIKIERLTIKKQVYSSTQLAANSIFMICFSHFYTYSARIFQNTPPKNELK